MIPRVLSHGCRARAKSHNQGGKTRTALGKVPAPFVKAVRPAPLLRFHFLRERTRRRRSTGQSRFQRRRRRRSEEHTSELQSLTNLVCRLLLEKKKNTPTTPPRHISQPVPRSVEHS